jgi:pimeloyl-ACP methyl ester carboxylesterase
MTVRLAGSLTLPQLASADRPVAALLLIQGSGPTDRNGNQPPALMPDLLRQLAEALAGADIATLRYDKRGMHANRASLPSGQDALAFFFSWSAFVGDAHAALGFLRQLPAIAPDRVGILGHSEGGLIALAAAADGARPRMLVLASTPGRPLGEVIHDQLATLLQRQQATAKQQQFILAADLRIRSAILATGKVPADVPPGLAALYPSYLGPFLKDELGLDPAALAGGYQSPVLVINGGADSQVSAARDAASFARALATRQDGSAVFMPDAVSHNLKPVRGADDPGVAGSVAASVREKLLSWAKAAL